MTMCRRPGRMPGRLSKVLRPMIIALPIVSALNRFRSPGMCQGRRLSLPMTPLIARARTMVIGGRAILGLYYACRAASRKRQGWAMTPAQQSLVDKIRSLSGEGSRGDRCRGHRALADRLARALARPVGRHASARIHPGGGSDRQIGGGAGRSAGSAGRQYFDGRRRDTASRRFGADPVAPAG